MKKGLILLLFTAFALTISSAQSDKQFSLLTKRTADWCPRCGEWGWTFAKDAIKELENENVIYWGMHFDGGLATPTSKAVAANFTTAYQPVFYINQDDQNVTSSNVAAKVASAKETIQTLNSFSADLKVGVTATIDGNNSITANARVKIEAETETDYHLALYLIRDNLVAYQASQGSSAVHPNILDKSFFSNAFGELVNAGNTINAGEVYEFNSTLENVSPHTSTISDIKVAAVLWYKIGNEYTFINGDIQSVQLQSSSNEIEKLDFTYSVSGQNLTIDFEDTIGEGATASLFSIDGKSQAVSNQSVIGNRLNATVNTLVPGAYVLRVIDGTKVGSRQLFIVE